MITVKNLAKHFGGIKAVDGVDLHIDKGSITGLVGPNGAGKTTMFNLIAGLYQPTDGEIILDGEDVTELTSHQLFHKGLLRTFQIAHEFPTLSVLENLMMVPANQLGESLVNTWLKRTQINEEEKVLQAKAEEVVDFLSISHLKNESAGNLSGGQKKKLVIAIALLGDPKILLLDEPFAALDLMTIKMLQEIVVNLQNESNISIILCDHQARDLLNCVDTAMVLSNCKIVASGTPSELINDNKAKSAYFGNAFKIN